MGRHCGDQSTVRCVGMCNAFLTAAPAAAAAGALVIGRAIAHAAIPDTFGVIHGCYDVKSGVLRV